MRPKSILLLALALGCGLIAMIGIQQVIARGDGDGDGVETVPVFVAKVAIPYGEKITTEMVIMEPWPKDKVPPGSVVNIEDIVGQMPRNQILPGYPIVEAALGADNARGSSGILEGYQTVAIKLTADQGGILLKIGDRVDVHVNLRKGAAPGIDQPMIKTILQDVAVFAVDGQFQNSAEEKENGANTNPVITLMVKPEEAQWVNLAKSVGDIVLSGRQVSDKGTTKTSKSKTLGQMLGLEDKDNRPDSNTAEKSGGLESLLNGVTEKPVVAVVPAINEDQTVFVMIGYEAGVATRYTYYDESQPPREVFSPHQRTPRPKTDADADADADATDSDDSTEDDSQETEDA